MVDIENSFMCSKVQLIYTTSITSLAFSPNGEYLAFGPGHPGLNMWEVSS